MRWSAPLGFKTDGTVARQKICAASAGDFLFMRFALIGSLESPPSI